VDRGPTKQGFVFLNFDMREIIADSGECHISIHVGRIENKTVMDSSFEFIIRMPFLEAKKNEKKNYLCKGKIQKIK
jgi:hypothetical protein